MPAESITPERQAEILRNLRLGGCDDLAAELESHWEAELSDVLLIASKATCTRLCGKLEIVQRQFETAIETLRRRNSELTEANRVNERLKVELDKANAATANQREVLEEVEREHAALTPNVQSKVRNALLAFSLLLLIAWNDTPHVLTLQPYCYGYPYGMPAVVAPGEATAWEWRCGETTIADANGRTWGPRMRATRWKGPGGGYLVRLVEGR